MTPDSFFTSLLGQSLLYPGIDEKFRGQCVQSVEMWIKALGVIPPKYPSAYMYYTNGVPGFTKVPRGEPIKNGDIIVWGANYPPAIINGVGNGHIDVACADGTINDFWAYDSNWKPLVLAKIHHSGSDNNYIIGYLRKEDEMLDGKDIATYKLEADTAIPYKNAVEASESWKLGMGQKVENITPIINALEDYKTELTKERDNTLYPFVNAVTAALDIPQTANVTVATNAIVTLKKGTPVDNTPNTDTLPQTKSGFLAWFKSLIGK